MEAEKSGNRYIVELKVVEGKDAAKYASEWVTLIAIAVDKEKRRVAEYLIERFSF